MRSLYNVYDVGFFKTEMLTVFQINFIFALVCIICILDRKKYMKKKKRNTSKTTNSGSLNRNNSYSLVSGRINKNRNKLFLHLFRASLQSIRNKPKVFL